MCLILLSPKAKSVLIYWYQKKLETAGGGKHGHAHCNPVKAALVLSFLSSSQYLYLLCTYLYIIIPKIKGWEGCTHTNVGIKQRIRRNTKLLVSSS